MDSPGVPVAGLRKTLSSTSLGSKPDKTDPPRFNRKFGKHIQKRQLEIPEYAASFVDYKALKKVLEVLQSLSDTHIDLVVAHQETERNSGSSSAK
jgi:CDK inhibitor PHO81